MSLTPTTTTTTTPSKVVSRSQPVSPAPRTPTSKLNVALVRRPASSDGLRRMAESNVAELRHVDIAESRHNGVAELRHVDITESRHNGGVIESRHNGVTESRHNGVTESRHNGVSQHQEPNVMRHNFNTQVSSPRPFFKVKSDSSLPASPSQRHPPAMRQLRHRVTVNGIMTSNVTSSASTQRSMSSASLIPAIAPLADIAEHSADLDLNRIRIIGESVSDQQQQRRRFDPPRLMMNEGRKSLSMTKISEKPIYLAEPHIRRNASWTTMTAALNS